MDYVNGEGLAKANNADDNKASVESLRAALSTKVTDHFNTGDVIRWVGGGIYTYAAVKCGNGLWSVTGSVNFYGDRQKTYEAITEILLRSDTTDVAVSTEWAFI